MPALSIATSVPVPMAMPTSAAASAGASLTPSPAIATTRPSRLQLVDHRALAVGQHLGLDLVDAERSRHGLRGGAVVAGQHDDAKAFGPQRLQRSGCGLLHRVGDGDDAGELAVDGDEDRGRAVAAHPFGFGVERLRRNAELAEKRRVAERDALSLDHADGALAGRRIEAAHGRKLDLAFGRRRDDGAGRADARSIARRWRRVAARPSSSKPSGALDRDDLGLAFGQRAGLVDHERVDRFHALQRLGVADQNARLRAAADADHDRHRRGKAERAGAGDDQHRDGGDQRVGEARLRPERRPGGEGQRPRPRSPPARTSPRHLIGEALDRRARALRRRHHLHDLRQHGVAADLLGAHDEAAAAVDGAADDLGADVLARPASTRRSPSIRRATNGPRSPRRRPAPCRRAARAACRRPRRRRARPPRRRAR